MKSPFAIAIATFLALLGSVFLNSCCGEECFPVDEGRDTTSYFHECYNVDEQALIVENETGDILIEGCGCDMLDVSAEITTYGDVFSPCGCYDDESVRVDVDIESKIRIRTVADNDSSYNADYEIDVPSCVWLERVENTSGTIHIKGLYGNPVLRSVSGDIVAENIYGSISACSESGEIRVRSVNAVGRLQTVSGNINADINPADVRREYDECLCEYEDIEIVSRSGNITLYLPDNASISVRIQNESGTLTVHDGIVISGTISEHRINGDIGNGSPMTLVIETDSGDIDIYEQ